MTSCSQLAAAGKLGDEDVVERQVERMLADPRARTLVTGFALRWLNVDELEAVVPDERLYPEFTDELRADFAQEIELFIASVLLENRNVNELLTAEHTFVNERLARHYGMGSVHGPQFRRVAVEDEARRGLLGKGAVLLRTSYGDRTSPVLRGAWVLDKIMGTPPTPPPPNVETDLSTPPGEKPKTVRARLEQHRADPSCNGCHGVIDPYGLALETFSATGQWRDFDRVADEQIDAATVLARRASHQRTRRAAASAAAAPRSIRAGADDEIDDVRLGARARIFRHAASTRRRARSRGRGLPVRRDRRRHRQQRLVPHAGVAACRDRRSDGASGRVAALKREVKQCS